MIWLARLAVRHPRLAVGATLLVTAVFSLGLLRIEMQTDGATLHPASNPLVQRSAVDREVFQDAELLVLLVERSPGGPLVASPEGFLFLRRLDESLRRIPGIRSAGVRSLASLQDLRVTAGSLSAVPFLDDVPSVPRAFQERLARIRRQALANGVLMSADGTVAAIYLPILKGVRHQQVLAEVTRFLGGLGDAHFRLRLTGALVAEARLGDSVIADLALLIPLMVLILVAIFWSLLRSAGALIVLVVEVAGVLIWTLGAMGLAGVPITLVTTLLPVLLMSIAVTDEVHLFERLQTKLGEALATSPTAEASRQVLPEALLAAMAELERPTLYAALTAALGFFAFPFSSVAPLQHFGLFSTLGLLVAVLLSFSAVPALMVLLPARWFLPRRRAEWTWRRRRPEPESRRLLPYEGWIAKHDRRGFAVGCLILLAALPGLFELRVADNWIANFDPSSELVAAERVFNRSLWGSYRFDVVLEGPRALFYTPRGVALIEDVARLASHGPGVSGVLTYLVPLREVTAAFGEQGDLRSLPRARLDDMLTLASISDDPFGMALWLAPGGDRARAQLFLKGEDYERDQRLAATLRRALDARLAGSGVAYHFSGDVPIGLEMVRVIVLNQLRSLGLTFLTMLVLLLILERSLRVTLAVMLPVSTAALLVFAGMGYWGVPLGVATSMFGSLTLGVGIDFSLHFLHSYRQERARSGDHRQALAYTFANTGKALRWSVLTLALSFLVLTLSDLRPNQSLGALLAAAMLSSYGMTLLFLPTLAEWVYRNDRRSQEGDARWELAG
ncbi:MAG TPA: MMPL family transporter [Thermoanaerobaculia bacterium]|nr:MMPL family transporter [Thermoanaerobaculia bacterium]